MKVLVTGSTGFVGANLVEGLTIAGHTVRAMVRASSHLEALAGLDYEPVIGDVLDPASLACAMKDIDCVFHVAAVADYWRQQNMAWLYRVNVGGTRHVLEAASSAGVRRVVFTSSAATLGVPHNNGACSEAIRPFASKWRGRNGHRVSPLIDESATFNLPAARAPYGHSKLLAEQVVHEFVDQGLDGVIVNPTVILGPRDLNFISGSVILAVYRRQVWAIPPGGVNYIDVADAVAGHIAAAERGKTGQRYILGAHNLTHRQAATIIAKTIGVAPPRLALPRPLVTPLALAVDLFNQIWPGQPLTDGNQVRLMKHTLFYDTSKAQQELALTNPLSFEVSVERAFHWYRDNGYLEEPQE
jgi:dihydroflavonol-4-reductase